MKIVRIVSELDFGGVEKVLDNTIPEINKIADVTIIVLGKGGRVAENLSKSGVKVIVLGKSPRIPNFSIFYELRKLINQIKPDVIHCQGSEANFHGILIGNLIKTPMIIGEEIGLPNHHSYWKWIFKYVYSKAHFVIAISESVSSYIVRLGEVPSEKIKVLYNPVGGQITGNSEENVSTQGIDSNQSSQFKFIYTGRLVKIKNLERLISAFSLLYKSNSSFDFKLWIVGEGPEKESLVELCEHLQIKDQVIFWGYQEDVFSFLRKADVFVLPSYTEGSSVSLIEAMKVGLPSIVTKNGGTSEVIGGSGSGVLIDPNNEEEIFHAMNRMADLSASERLQLGEKAKNEIKRFSVEAYLEQLMKIYQNDQD
ncbi:Glycosyltransferase involved in cell wall bisynthesis [Aquiflexum balticum DSM 16537]|uniref:Glycosyltransferase involved in cell wall bisynthesis n=1 Tax=Aquiflexum balticum DSM 16537 TaxID=758820 RepID=A0A1W2HB05_9BACT|nr:glycosyltransferase [Aquiflexum balticum]SMD46053.1 Glycosyltransferase involved in cell wall bisynthesis [Aquiflexum balticum DSM 16537]